MLTQATPVLPKSAADSEYAAPAADVTATLFTYVISPVDDGVRITVSPVAGIARFQAASVRVTLTSEP